MEFWGVEVKAGEPLKVKPELSKFIHLSQAVLGETKKDKGDDSIIINVKVGNQKLVLGHLSLEKLKQLQFDLVFEKEFELSHNWKKGSVYFSGYQSAYGDDSDDFDDSDLGDSEEEELIPAIPNGKPGQNGEQAKQAINKVNASKPQASEKPKIKVVEPSKDDDSDEEEDASDDDEDEIEELIPANAIQNGKPSQKVEQAKPATAKANASKPQVSEKPKAKVVEPSLDDDSDDDDLDEDDDESDEDEEGSEDESDEDMLEADSDEDDEIDEKHEETPKKVQSGKKRPNESASKTPVSAKKVKADTPQKTGGKKEGHVVTPHPAKKAGKTPASPEKSKAQTPKSSGQISCKSCTKTFGSETALGSHTKAKHA